MKMTKNEVFALIIVSALSSALVTVVFLLSINAIASN